MSDSHHYSIAWDSFLCVCFSKLVYVFFKYIFNILKHFYSNDYYTRLC